MCFARHWRFALLLFFIGWFGWTSPFFPNKNRKGCLTSRCLFFPPPMRWGIYNPYFEFLALHLSESRPRPGSRRSNNRRGASQYTIARSNWESYYT
uniref:Secreted protein n=1 Tax=Kalanchoe fedtschenkoi TaxID=63787 RepID=A0A7N0UL45_KALFE